MKTSPGLMGSHESNTRPLDRLEVDISVFGRFQAYRLAAEMGRLGVLHTLYTSYPKVIPGVGRDGLCNPFLLKSMEAALLRVMSADGARERICEYFASWFDRYVARRIRQSGRGESRVLHGWASHCLETLKTARSCGYKTFLESSCPHPIFKATLLTEEAERVGTSFKPSPRWIDQVSAECELADYIVVPSGYSHDSFIRLGYPDRKLLKVPIGVDSEEIKPDVNHDVSVGRQRPFKVLMVGTDPLRKGTYYLLQAWEKLRLRNAELVIRCGVPKKAMPFLNQPSVTHVPPVSRAKLIRLYQEATVFCFPSVDDGFGLVALEAMAAGLPVIITDHVGAKDIMTNGIEGFVVPIRDVEKLQEKIAYFYENPEAVTEMGRRGRKLAEQYGWSRYGETLLDAYRASVKKR